VGDGNLELVRALLMAGADANASFFEVRPFGELATGADGLSGWWVEGPTGCMEW
jgi:hypothetical protein